MVPSGEQGIDLNAFVIGRNEDGAVGRQPQALEAVIQGHPPAERPAAACVEGEPPLPVRFHSPCSHEAGKRRVSGDHGARRAHRSRCGLAHRATALTPSSKVLPASLGLPPTNSMPLAAAQGASVRHWASAQLALLSSVMCDALEGSPSGACGADAAPQATPGHGACPGGASPRIRSVKGREMTDLLFSFSPRSRYSYCTGCGIGEHARKLGGAQRLVRWLRAPWRRQ